MKLIIDIGNTVAKLVAFDGDEPVEEIRTCNDSLSALGAFATKYAFTHGIVGTVKGLTAEASYSDWRTSSTFLPRHDHIPIPVITTRLIT